LPYLGALSNNRDVFNTFLRKAETKRWTTQQ
jgi:hypothetical protein